MSSKGYNYLKVDEKKMKRMISNRESARRSRMKKEQHMKDLNDQIFYLTKKRDEMLLKIDGIAKENTKVEMENMVLRSQKQELEKRLEYANQVCGWYEGDGDDDVSLASMGGVQEPWIRPWEQKQPSNSMPVMSSSVGFSFF
ncbi:bZIP transcription factor 53-like [Bidens hawaiensis]|uniref:bZIP transcription factor 53-like n=1 Tax=Bidens hawaiensis TaxID=980011 RepID=UPI00404970CC